MKFIPKIAFIAICIMATLASCVEKPVYPDTPIIKLENFIQFNGDSAWFIISFTDGDGDVGLRPQDTIGVHHPDSGKFHYNFFIEPYEMQNGEWVSTNPLFPFYYRIPYITPEGRNKVLEGEIKVKLEDYISPSPFDTVRFDAYMYDRALNKSNVISTGAMRVTKRDF
jgi:hypothetical protein